MDAAKEARIEYLLHETMRLWLELELIKAREELLSPEDRAAYQAEYIRQRREKAKKEMDEWTGIVE